ncbi:MAG: amino acid adenylation domain-containing protein [Pirellulaceae bacterium]|nr:amino acid adenylation domain-containing protein [Pirellulaceae bacterium]
MQENLSSWASERGDSERDGRRIAPLSFGQERLWILDQVQRGNLSYNRPSVFSIAGPLQAAVLERCLNEIVARHESLRTRFPQRDGEPVQEVLPPVQRRLEVVDLSDCAESEREGLAQQWIRQQTARPFDLAAAPPIQAHLLRLGTHSHRLLLNMHHIVFDGWSQGVFLREMTTLYGAFAGGHETPLPPLELQYPDLAIRQRRQWAEGQQQEHLDYWRQQLSDYRPESFLPTDFRPTGHVSDESLLHRFTVPEPTVRALRKWAGTQRTTLFMALVAAFKTLLYRSSDVEDILVGMPVAGRSQADTEAMIGLLINTLPLRVDLSGNPDFATLLQRVRRVALEAYQHQETPLQKILEQIPKTRVAGQPYTMPVFVNFRPADAPHTVAGVSFTVETMDHLAAITDLSLDFKQAGDLLRVELAGRADLFERASLARMAEQYTNMLSAVAEHPETRLGGLPMLDDRQRHRVLVEWNATDCDEHRPGCLHHFFEAAARRTPHHVAVVAPTGRLTYAELDARANQVAHYLREQGIGVDSLVALDAERSLEQIVALLGILKAGAAYVPVETKLPVERVRWVLEETQATLLTTHVHRHPSLPVAEARHLCLERDADQIARQSVEPVETAVAGSDLAYIIYTSGSTGRPKGVMVEHQSVVHFLQSMLRIGHSDASDRVLQFATLAFDSSVEDIFGPLAAGATLVLRTEDSIASVAAFLDSIDHWGITVLPLPTAYWHELTRYLRVSSRTLPVRVRLVVIGGEKAEVSAWEDWRQTVGPHVRLLNSYGPTETTVYVIAADVSPSTYRHRSGRELPIGRPLPNSKAYVLDRRGEPVPIGVPGELYIAGAQLTRGYWKRPDLTAERFVMQSVDGQNPVRMYRTGDRVRWRDDGQLEYLGRIDHQIKLRGFRIEPGEIEAAIIEHPGVQSACVVARGNDGGDQRLVAYLVSAGVHPPDSAELRAFLGRSLPEYMVPSSVVFLPAMPLTVQGKVDRAALPEPQWLVAPGPATTLPRNEIEQRIAAIWREVLGLPEVGIADSFFALGGHSLTALRLLTRLRQQFDLEVPFRDFFAAPTIAALADLVRRRPVGVPTPARTPSLLEIAAARRRGKRVA